MKRKNFHDNVPCKKLTVGWGNKNSTYYHSRSGSLTNLLSMIQNAADPRKYDPSSLNPNMNNQSNFSSNLDICSGKNCDHNPNSKIVPIIPVHLVNINSDYKLKLRDLIDLGRSYHCKLQTKFHNINLKRLSDLVPAMIKLSNMIGLSKEKNRIVKLIIYYLLDMEPNPTEMLHSVISGPPGIGKSRLISILGEIYLGLGYLKNNIIKHVKRSDLIGKYLGHTADKTQTVINEAMGGILVIDEAYSLGNPEKNDSYSKECIDTINRNLTENAGKFICIIAGYDEELDTSFFSYNPGLKSRFKFRFRLKKYSAEELQKIFYQKIQYDGWETDILPQEITLFFKKNYENFIYQGRDIENLLFYCKLAHANRIFLEPIIKKKKLSISDINNGYKLFLKHSYDKKINCDKFNPNNKMTKEIRSMFI